VDQAAEPIPPLNCWCRRRGDETQRGPPAARSREAKRALGSVTVVVVDVDAQDALEMPATEDQEPVEALSSHRADEALGDRVRLGSPDRRADDLDALASEDLVEGGAELGVVIVD
jgi:hypothetical protein